jgi:hypothetical protein
MSLSLYLEVPGMVEVASANFTHNTTPMWRKAGCYDALYNSQGKKASEVVGALRQARDAMLAHPEVYRALDPPNGWGKFDDAYPWLCEVVEHFTAHPDAIIRVSR